MRKEKKITAYPEGSDAGKMKNSFSWFELICCYLLESLLDSGCVFETRFQKCVSMFLKHNVVCTCRCLFNTHIFIAALCGE